MPKSTSLFVALWFSIHFLALGFCFPGPLQDTTSYYDENGRYNRFEPADARKNFAKFSVRNLNKTIDPCEDFYHFTCSDASKSIEQSNKFEIDHNIRKMLNTKTIDENGNERTSESLTRLRTLYSSCMKQVDAEPNYDGLRHLIGKLGGLPLIGSNSSWHEGRQFKMEETLIVFRRLGISFGDIFSIWIASKPGDRKKMLLNIKMPKHMSHGIYAVKPILEELYGPRDFSHFEQVDSFRMKLNSLKDLELSRGRTGLHQQVLDIEQLEMSIQGFNWRHLIENIVDERPSSDSKTEILVNNLEYLTAVANLIKNTEHSVLANYVILRVIQDMGSYVVSSPGVRSQPRSADCIEMVKQNLGLDLSIEYQRHYVSSEKTRLASEMFLNIRQELVRSLERVTWIKSEQTRSNLMDKVNQMTHSTGLDDWVMRESSDILQMFYGDLRLDEGASLLDNILLITREKYTGYFDRLLCKTNDIIEYLMAYDLRSLESTEMSGYYMDSINYFTLNAGHLLQFHLDPARFNNANYAITGALIAQEIVKAVSLNDQEFDCWDKETKSEYHIRAECLRNEYEKARLLSGNIIGVDTNSSLGENIADNLGIQLAYRAYQSWLANSNNSDESFDEFNGRQLFWIAYGVNRCGDSNGMMVIKNGGDYNSVHSSPQLRVNIPLMNSLDFGEDFNCSPESGMNKADGRCKLW